MSNNDPNIWSGQKPSKKEIKVAEAIMDEPLSSDNSLKQSADAGEFIFPESINTTISRPDIEPREDSLAKNITSGPGNTLQPEITPEYNKADNEIVIPSFDQREGKTNSIIVFGRDRNIGVETGYGGKGHTKSSAIDIIVGLQGFDARAGSSEDKTGKRIAGYANKNFGSMRADKPGDAARIFISQRCDIDNYFDIAEGSVGNSIADSAIGMKADSVRIMARKGIKLVTGGTTARLANDGKKDVIYGIDLIAGNIDIQQESILPIGKKLTENERFYLQPIPKGYNLEECLEKMNELIMVLNTKINNVVNLTNLLTFAVSQPMGGVAAPAGSIQIVDNSPWVEAWLTYIQTRLRTIGGELYKHRIDIIGVTGDYLKSGSAAYINSKHNRTN